jgi:hypothetical protein
VTRRGVAAIDQREPFARDLLDSRRRGILRRRDAGLPCEEQRKRRLRE